MSRMMNMRLFCIFVRLVGVNLRFWLGDEGTVRL